VNSQFLRNTMRVTSALRSNLGVLGSLTLPPKSQLDLSVVPLQIRSSSPVTGKPYRWEYTVGIATVEKDGDAWTNSEDAIELPKARNGWEADNTSSMVLALSGEDPSDLQTGFSVDPLPNGLVTMGYLQYYSDAGTTGAEDIDGAYYLINEPNPIGGTCS